MLAGRNGRMDGVPAFLVVFGAHLQLGRHQQAASGRGEALPDHGEDVAKVDEECQWKHAGKTLLPLLQAALCLPVPGLGQARMQFSHIASSCNIVIMLSYIALLFYDFNSTTSLSGCNCYFIFIQKITMGLEATKRRFRSITSLPQTVEASHFVKSHCIAERQ